MPAAPPARDEPVDLVLRDLACVVPMDGDADDPIGTVRSDVDLAITGDRIVAIAPDLAGRAGPTTRIVDGTGLVAVPGFVQGHLHFCQTLLRGLADDRALMPWLRTRVWPFEAALDAAATRASAELSLCELLLGGTTTVQVMESTRHVEQSFEACATAGITAIVGNCLMDRADDEAQRALASPTAGDALRVADELRVAFDGVGRLHYAVSPRFILSCSDELSRSAAGYASEHGLRVHTHACEHPDEVRSVRQAFATDYLLALDDQGLLGARTGLAHCVHLTDAERDVLEARGAAVLHCPSTNLKLGSGIAPVATYRERSVPVALGADGAPCNNRLSALTELRQAALLQAAVAGPGRWPAAAALDALTRGGAAALGLGDVGSLRPGHRADVVLLDLRSIALEPGGDPVSRIVWSADDGAVRHVVVGGNLAVEDRTLRSFDVPAVQARATATRDATLSRAGLAR